MEIGTVRRLDIEQKMRVAYLSYAMSVITARALPDVRDGLKPVQRRVLYAMHDMGLRHDQPTRKSARVVGEVLGKYHPHSDVAVYDAMVRMAQDFTMRYVLVDGQGNFGSVDGDDAAAMRYTEVRLAPLGEELLADIDRNTVDFVPNFDNSLTQPAVLPARLPNLLVNGVGGIAVGMATNIPPHNLGEVADAIAYLIDHYHTADDISVDDLMQFVQGPDFPSSGTIIGREEIHQAYATGRGRIVVRAQAHIEDLRGHATIIITELPYQVNKAGLVERIAELVRDGRVEGIGDVRDESDRTGMRVVVELKRGIEANAVLGQLLKLTQMQSTFGVNMLALVDGEPRVLPLKRILLYYVEHRRQVVVRRAQFDLERALARAHILEGLLIALEHLDEVIAIIRRSRTADTAQEHLRSRFKLSELQARAILDMQLRRLAALERKKIEEEHQELLKQITYLRGLLGSEEQILAVIRADVIDLKQRYADPRRTRIVATSESAEFRAEELLPDEEAIVVLARSGLLQRAAPPTFWAELAHSREGPANDLLGALLRGSDHDGLLAALPAHSRESVLVLTAGGWAYQLPVHQIPDSAQQPRGLSAGNLAQLAADERLVAALRLAADRNEADGDAGPMLTLATRQGKIKRLSLAEMGTPGSAGALVIGLDEGDALGWACLTGRHDELLLVTAQGRAIRFQEDTVRPQGRSAGGMRGITLAEGDAVVSMLALRVGVEAIIATAHGFAKRCSPDEYPVQGRGGLGVLTVDAARLADTGPVVAACLAPADGQVILSSASGQAWRIAVSAIPTLPRASWGRVVSKSRRGASVQLQRDDQVISLLCPPEAPHPPAAEVASKGAGPRKRAAAAAAGEPTPRAEPKADGSAVAPATSPASGAPGAARRGSAPPVPKESDRPKPQPRDGQAGKTRPTAAEAAAKARSGPQSRKPAPVRDEAPDKPETKGAGRSGQERKPAADETGGQAKPAGSKPVAGPPAEEPTEPSRGRTRRPAAPIKPPRRSSGSGGA